MIICAVTAFGWAKDNMHEKSVVVHQPLAIERNHPIIAAIFAQLLKESGLDAFEREGLHIAVRWEGNESKDLVKTTKENKDNGQTDTRNKKASRKRAHKATALREDGQGA